MKKIGHSASIFLSITINAYEVKFYISIAMILLAPYILAGFEPGLSALQADVMTTSPAMAENIACSLCSFSLIFESSVAFEAINGD
jgi:hypothetical protein